MDLTGTQPLERVSEKDKQEQVQLQKQEFKYLNSYLGTNEITTSNN